MIINILLIPNVHLELSQFAGFDTPFGLHAVSSLNTILCTIDCINARVRDILTLKTYTGNTIYRQHLYFTQKIVSYRTNESTPFTIFYVIKQEINMMDAAQHLNCSLNTIRQNLHTYYDLRLNMLKAICCYILFKRNVSSVFYIIIFSMVRDISN